MAALLAAAPAGPALAFDLFGLFGGDQPPQPTPAALPYRLTVTVVGDADLKDALEDASTLHSLRKDSPPDGATLVQRLKADFAPMLDALWGAGYYNARLVATVAGVPVVLGSEGGADAAVAAADRLRGRAVVPIVVTADPGPLFRLRTIAVVDADTGRAVPDAVLPARTLKLQPGDPARAADIRAADARLIDWFRGQGHPLVRAPLPSPTVDHAAATMDVTFKVAPGPVAGFGAVTVNGPQHFSPAVVRSFIALGQGQTYSPKALEETRRAVAAVPAIGSVRIREADHLDPDGNLPLTVDVTDRKPNLVGFTGGFSSVDGPTASVYYENRNLFGGAERLRLQGDLFLAPRIAPPALRSFKDFRLSDIGERFTVGFMKPALNGSRVDLLLDAGAERTRVGDERFGGYEDRLVGGTAALRLRLGDAAALQAGVKVEDGQTQDTLGRLDYLLVGLPVLARYDTTDRLLDPTSGIRATATITPYASLAGTADGFTRASATASAYYALDADARYILAGRVGFGSVFGEGGGLGGVPANYRFYVGGLDSVRGYRYHTISPTGGLDDTITGGLSAFSAQLEARIKVTDTIGLAPFFDIGGAYGGSVPFTGGGTARSAAGLGLLYYTAIGPIRVDVAVPLDPRRADQRVALYVSIGQPF